MLVLFIYFFLFNTRTHTTFDYNTTGGCHYVYKNPDVLSLFDVTYLPCAERCSLLYNPVPSRSEGTIARWDLKWEAKEIHMQGKARGLKRHW